MLNIIYENSTLIKYKIIYIEYYNTFSIQNFKLRNLKFRLIKLLEK